MAWYYTYYWLRLEVFSKIEAAANKPTPLIFKDPKAAEEPMLDEDLLESEGKNLRMKKEIYEMTQDIPVDDFTR
jgi:hypothetical protein